LLQGIDIGNDMLDPSISGQVLQRLKPLLGDSSEKEDIADRMNRNSVFLSLIVGQFQLPDVGPVRLLMNVEN